MFRYLITCIDTVSQIIDPLLISIYVAISNHFCLYNVKQETLWLSVFRYLIICIYSQLLTLLTTYKFLIMTIEETLNLCFTGLDWSDVKTDLGTIPRLCHGRPKEVPRSHLKCSTVV